jgi:endonuclease YncB( thermonuclease family)
MGKVVRFHRSRRSSVSQRVLLWLAVCLAVPAFAGLGALTPSPDSSSPPLSRVSASSGREIGDLVGRASITDADTITIGVHEVRFHGIDAPESSQRCKDAEGRTYPCGRIAAKALNEFLAASRPTTCEFVEWDKYGRFVGNCRRADGVSVSVWLVQNGHAMDWPLHSNGIFAADQAAARAKRIGIWQGEVQPPWEYRAERRAGKNSVTNSVAPQSLMSGSCNIKGNISSKGERIYHVPGQRDYNKTKIDRSKGERIFCSEAEARQAGWRRAKR